MAINVPIVSTFDSKGINKALREFRKLETGSQKAAFGLVNIDQAARRGVASFGKYAAIGAGVVGFLGSKLVTAAYESQKVMRQTQAIITATGGAAGLTADQVAKLSEKLAMQIGVDDELIQSSANLLLTFKQIQNQVGANNNIFDRALTAAQDLGNVFGSADSAALQLGKALSNPVKGLTALTRSGINFSAQQTEQIKTLTKSGNILEAQKIILSEIESQVGGTAAASATAFDKMKVATGNVAEGLGELLLPYVERFSDFINNNVVPVMERFTTIVGEDGLGAGFNYLSGSIINGINNMGAFGKVIFGVVGGFVALRTATIAYTATQGILAVAQNLVTSELRKTAIQANATKYALIAAGGAAALVTVAASVYAMYASQKAKAEEQTRKLVEALLMEKNAQSGALAELVKSDNQFKIMVASLGDLGLSMDDVTEYINTGTGSFAKFVAALDMIPASASKGIGQLDAYAKAAGISATQFSSAGGQIAYGMSALAALARTARGDAVDTQNALKLLGAVGVSSSNDVATSLGGVGKAVESAKEKFDKYLRALRSYRDSKEAYVKAEKDVQKTKESVTKATNAQAVAQAKFNQIVKGFGAGSLQAADAQKQLEQAQRDAERAGYDLEKSRFAVTDAEEALAQARQEGDSQTIREAEIALAEAILAVREAEINQKDATDSVNAAQLALTETINGAAESSNTYKDALKELQDANYELEEAINAANEALKRQRDAQENVNQAEGEAISGSKGLTPKQKKRAERRVQVDVPKKRGNRGKAVGGFVNAGESYVVGERGRELFTPSSSGVITPNNKLGGDTYNIVINSKIADEALPDLIVAELRKFNRRSGAIKIQVA